jgi:hypothetical protein
MTPLEHVQQLFAELGPASEDVATVAQGPDGCSWAIEMADEAIVSVEFDAERERIALTIGLPKPAADRRIDTLEALLTFNLLWQSNSALRMAMDQPGGEIVQVAELATAHLDVAKLGTALAEFLALAERWRTAIATGCTTAVELAAPENFGASAMRV